MYDNRFRDSEGYLQQSKTDTMMQYIQPAELYKPGKDKKATKEDDKEKHLGRRERRVNNIIAKSKKDWSEDYNSDEPVALKVSVKNAEGLWDEFKLYLAEKGIGKKVGKDIVPYDTYAELVQNADVTVENGIVSVKEIGVDNRKKALVKKEEPVNVQDTIPAKTEKEPETKIAKAAVPAAPAEKTEAALSKVLPATPSEKTGEKKSVKLNTNAIQTPKVKQSPIKEKKDNNQKPKVTAKNEKKVIPEKQSQPKAIAQKHLLQDRLQLLKLYYDYKKTEGSFKNIPATDEFHVTDPQRNRAKESEKAQLQKLNQALKDQNFSGIGEFEAYINNYEKKFRKKTVELVNKQLQNYTSVLNTQNMKLMDDKFLEDLLQSIKKSGASKHYKQYEKFKSSASNLGFEEKPTAQITNIKEDLNDKADAEAKQGNAGIGKLVSKMPLVNDNNFNKQKFAQVKTKEELKEFLSEYIESRYNDVLKTHQHLSENGGENIYNYPELITFSKQQQGIENGGVVDTIINHKSEEKDSEKLINAMVLGVLAVALGLLTFGTGTVALAMAAGSFGIGAYITAEEINAYQNQLAAYNVNISQNEPHAVWVIISVVGTVLDAVAIAKISRQLVNAGRILNTTGDESLAHNALKAAGLDAETEGKVMKALEEEAKEIRKSLDEKVAEKIKGSKKGEKVKPTAKEKVVAENAAEVKKTGVINAEVEVIANKKIWTGKNAEAFLDSHAANAMYMPGEAGKSGVLILRESSEPAVIMEELLHLEQHRLLGFKALSAADILRMENEAHEALLVYARNKGWAKAEIEHIEANKEYWASKQESYKTNPKEFEEEIRALKNRRAATAEELADLAKTRAEVDIILKPYADEIKEMYPNSMVGYRGSLASGYKYDPPHLPFTSKKFDVDAFIIDNHLAEEIGKFKTWRDANKLDEFQEMIMNLKTQLYTKFPGYEGGFTFRVWTSEEYVGKVSKHGHKLL